MATRQEWTEYYLAELDRHSVTSDDARAASYLSWNIAMLHQMLYGPDSNIPVSFCVLEDEQPDHAVAACSGGRFGGRGEYLVYPVGLHRLSLVSAQILGPAVTQEVALDAIAFHELRHRIQDTLPGLPLFIRPPEGTWADRQTLVVAYQMDLHFREQEQVFRSQGMPEEDIAWKLSDLEFDAAVVERLYLHRSRDIKTEEDIVNFLKMSQPRIRTVF